MNKSRDHFSDKNSPVTQIPATLADASVCIWGLGLMGGSLAMALKGKTKTLYAVDPDLQVCKQALALQIIDRVSNDASELLPLADLIILAAPLGMLPSLITQLPQLHTGAAVVIDLGSTKTNILTVMEQLPARFSPVGGHPMCGKEVRSLLNATADLYRDASFVLLPLARTPQPAFELVLQLVSAIGAHPIWLDAATHEKWAASISHLPYLVANSLSSITPIEAAPLTGPGYTSTTRLAVESIDMMMDILLNNRKNILPYLHDFIKRIELVENKLTQEDYPALRELFTQGAERRTAVLDAFKQWEEQ
jgi:prephenate dehydrogenase